MVLDTLVKSFRLGWGKSIDLYLTLPSGAWRGMIVYVQAQVFIMNNIPFL